MWFLTRKKRDAVFLKLKEKYGGLMLWVARDILRDPRDVDDAMQEAFVTIYKEISKLSDIEHPKTKGYIVTVIRSKSINIYNQNKRHEEEPLEENLAAPPEDTGALGACMLRLEPRKREMLLLKYHYGYSVKEIAEMMELPVESAYKLHQQAKRELETLCREEGLL